MYGLGAYAGLPPSEQMLHDVHFLLCVFAVLIACLPLLAAKGSVEHKFGGLIYVPVSFAALALATIMAWRESSPVLFCFNGFCAYLLLSGWRAARAGESLCRIDWFIPFSLGALSVGAAGYALSAPDSGRSSFYLLFFAMNGFYLAGRDLQRLRRRKAFECMTGLGLAYIGPAEKDGWLGRHIAGMAGSALANLSVVVLTLLPLGLHWLWPAGLLLATGALAFTNYRKKAALRRAVAVTIRPPFSARRRDRPSDRKIRRAA